MGHIIKLAEEKYVAWIYYKCQYCDRYHVGKDLE